MNNKIENRQITLDKIQKIADFLEDYKEEYDKKFEKDNQKNDKLSYKEKKYEYGNGDSSIKYTIYDKNGKTMTENNYNWFVSYLNQAYKIKNINIHLGIRFEKSIDGTDGQTEYNSINIDVDFYENRVSIDVGTRNQENEAHNLCQRLREILENSDERWNGTIRHRNLRIQSVCISIGLILSYILFIILKINITKIPNNISEYLNNKMVIIIGQWMMAIALGNIIGNPIMQIIYGPLIPEKKYAGYDASSGRSRYRDDVEDYIGRSEVQIGKYFDAGIRRKRIEKMYKICKIILLIQLFISILLFLILK